MKKSLSILMVLMALSYNASADTQAVAQALDAENIQLAEQAFAQLAKKEQASIEGQVLAGRIMLDKEDTEAAFEHFEALSEKFFNNVDVHYYLGVSAVVMAQKASIFSKLGYAEDFLEAMEKTIALKPDHLAALNTLIGFHLGAPSIAGGDTDKALAYASKVKEIDEEQGYSQLAKVYYQTESNDLAEQTINEGLEKYPESAELYFVRANASMQAKAWHKARPDLAQAIKYAKDDDEKSRALYQQGKASAESGQAIELGIESLIQALPIADKQYQPWVKYRLAQLYTAKNELKKAHQLISTINLDEDDDLKTKVKKLNKKLKKLLS